MDVDLPSSDVVCLSMPLDDMSGTGQARRVAVRFAEALRFGEEDVGRVALIVTEAATNIVQHAGHGEILIRAIHLDDGAGGVEILALNQGGGMSNVGECLKDGFSSGGSSGAGLGAIQRLSDAFDIFSAPGMGTALLARVGKCSNDFERAPLKWGVVCVPIDTEEVCGDAWAIEQTPNHSTILIVDGLGHGLYASEAAKEALEGFDKVAGNAPAAVLQTLDRRLQTTRGAVALSVNVDWLKREVRHAGIGNIAGSLLRPEQRNSGLISQPGTVGQAPDRIREFTHAWPDKGLMVLHSDGLSSRWRLDDYPGLSEKDPSLIAGVLYRDFRRPNDDAVVFVCRERGRASIEEEGK